MPPKAARGASRGRGRGRGKAPAPESSSTASPALNEPEPESQSTITDSPMHDVEAATITTPPREENTPQEQNDPNSTPATQPTETPASTPVRSAAQIQTQTEGSYGANAGSGMRGRGRGRGKESKFKPRNVRRDLNELKEIEAREQAKEQARLSALAATAARSRGRAFRGGRGGRGRGHAMGQGGLGRGMQGGATASGPFGVAPAGSNRKPGLSGPGNGPKRESGPSHSTAGAGGTSGSRIKTEVGSFGQTGGNGVGGSYDSTAGRYIPEPQYPEGDSDTPRVDIERINQISDDDDDDVIFTGSRSINKGKGRASSNRGGLKPIRLDRKEHKERITMVNTEPPTKATMEDEKGDPDTVMVDENRSSRAVPPSDQKEWKGVYQDEDVVQVKSEPDVLISDRSFSRERTVRRPSSPPLPEFKKPLVELDAIEPEPEPATEHESPGTDRKAQPRRHSKRKDKKPVIQTEEDRAEWARHLQDMEVLRDELGGMQANLGEENERGKDVEGDLDMETGPAEAHDKKEGRLYLFQFPPVLPKLYNPLKSPNPNIVTPAGKEREDDVEIMESGDQIDLTKDKVPKVKSEGEEVIIKKEDDNGVEQEREKLVQEEGWIGKLIVRESGRVELSWGGTNMIVGRGVDAGFLSTGMVVDGMGLWGKDDNGRQIRPAGGSEGKALAMGQVMGKFVVVPDWDGVS